VLGTSMGLEVGSLTYWARRTSPPKAQLAILRETLGSASRGGVGGDLPYVTWERATLAGQALLYKEGCGQVQATLNPSRDLPLLPFLLLGEALSAKSLHHTHRAIVLRIPSTSPPYSLDRGRRRHHCVAHVHHSKVSLVLAF
jgi:hypothetical protein